MQSKKKLNAALLCKAQKSSHCETGKFLSQIVLPS